MLPKFTNNSDMQVSKIWTNWLKNAGLFDTQVGKVITDIM